MNPYIDAIAQFVEILFKIGVKEWPAISDAIGRATRGEDPLAGVAKERIDGIIPNGQLQLDLEMAAQRLRVEHEKAGLSS